MKSSQNLINYLLFNTKNYFQNAEEFIRLERIHKNPSWMLLIDMWLTPLIFIFNIFITDSLPNVLSVMGLYKSFRAWVDYFRYQQLRTDCIRWKLIVDSFGGPFIATNNMRYLPYVYADGMQRIHNDVFKRHTSPQARPTHSNQLRK
jgi:hypothetical protein